jgi:hypothetical protein
MNASPQLQALRTGGYISTSMVFQTKGFQNAANATYEFVSSYNSTKPNTPYTFKTDRERMLFKIGQLGSVPGAAGFGY